MRPSDILAPYDDVITIKTQVGRVPVYKFIEKFIKITDKDSNIIPFILNDDQADLYKQMCLQKLEGKPIRINILKARQIGFSTFISAVIFVLTIFQPMQSAVIIADTSEHARDLLRRKYMFFYDNLPNDIKKRFPLITRKEAGLSVSWGNGKSSDIRVAVQGQNAGRSGTFQYLHLSECAFWDNLNETLVSLLQTISGNNKNSMVFFETTANGVNDYKLRWDKDLLGKNNYKALFYPWYTDKSYVQPKVPEYIKPAWLEGVQEKYHLNEEQVRWYYEKYMGDMNEDLDTLKQEFPSSPTEAFITTGNSVFNTELLLERKDELLGLMAKGMSYLKKGDFRYNLLVSQDGKRITLDNLHFVDSRSGSVTIYEEPNPTHPYVCSNDPAMGGEDYFAIQVFDNYTGHQVAVYHKNKCDADDCAYQLYALGKYYNDAMITGETNTTSYILQTVQKCGYKFIYQDQDIEDLGTRFYNKLGFKTKTTNRQTMIEMFAIAFRENPKIINDYETICEMENFQIVKSGKNDKEKAMATGGAHDDLVMSACGFYLCRGMQSAVPKPNMDTKKMSIEEYKWDYINKKQEQKTTVKKVYEIWD